MTSYINSVSVPGWHIKVVEGTYASNKTYRGKYVINKVIWYALRFISSDGKYTVKLGEYTLLSDAEKALQKQQQDPKLIPHSAVIYIKHLTYTHYGIYDRNQDQVIEYPDQVIERARSKIGSKDYSLFNRNCEHFAMWAKTGECFSTQVVKQTKTAATVLPYVSQFVGHLANHWSDSQTLKETIKVVDGLHKFAVSEHEESKKKRTTF
mmetsp:Transcript_29140/g.32356  ORF Transcript_29140/g.32356 Transcript_29140/m.32356 type:complete len:208 (-) Transcript_29140:52-675(-)